MPLIILAALTFLASAFFGAQTTTTTNPFLNTPSTQPISDVCLDDNIATNGIDPAGINVPAKLASIKKPDRSSIEPGQGYEIARCANSGSCDPNDPAEAEYLLVATNVKVDPIIFGSGYQNVPPSISDRQMVRQADISSVATAQQMLKNRIYRTFCGDWCFTCGTEDVICDPSGNNCFCKAGSTIIKLPFRGSFHCNFVFYLQDKDEAGHNQIVDGVLQSPNPADSRLPQNGSFFSVYFRKGAKIPEIAQCRNPAANARNGSNLFDRIFAKNQTAYAQSGQTTFLYPPGNPESWLFRTDDEIKNTEINLQWSPYPGAGSNVVTDPLPQAPGRFEVYKNLVHPTRDDAIYLVEEGKLKEALDLLLTPTPPPVGVPTTPPTLTIRKIHYKEFNLLATVKPSGVRSLQLGTFFPSVAPDWIRKWFKESKPAIYLYPPHDLTVNVKLHPAGAVTNSNPPYDPENGWQNVLAHTDGSVTVDGQTYPHLFYEADLTRFTIGSEGNVVPTRELHAYLEKTLPELGLEGREVTEFMDYWLAKLPQDKPYYFIQWLSPARIEQIEPLYLSVKPDSEIRIRAYFKPLANSISVAGQKLPTPPQRQGFTLVEWGGILDQ